MHGIHPFSRPVLLAAAAVLLAGSACFPPIAWHDGLPAWSPDVKKVEWRVGYHQLSAFAADSFALFGDTFARPDFSVGYLTPGVRWGLGRGPVMADIGFASVVATGGTGVSLLAGPAFGIGYGDRSASVMFRPSIYLLSAAVGADGGVQLTPWYQATLLVGNGYRARGVNFALGGRASPFAAGPAAFVGVNLYPVDFRAELSYMLPVSVFVTGNALTIGITAAAPTRAEPGSEQNHR